MSKSGIAESLPIFRYLVGKYKRVVAFDEYGLARIDFAITRGKFRGLHGVMIEPFLLQVPQPRSTISVERAGRKRPAAHLKC
jgi:hypothetical protein